MVKRFPRRQLGDALGVRMGCFEKRHTLGLNSILFVLLFLKMSIALCSLCPYPLEH